MDLLLAVFCDFHLCDSHHETHCMYFPLFNFVANSVLTLLGQKPIAANFFGVFLLFAFGVSCSIGR